jgi:hypothetical protein
MFFNAISYPTAMAKKVAMPVPSINGPSEVIVKPNLFRYFQGVYLFMFTALLIMLVLEGQLWLAIIALILVVYSGITFILALQEWLKVDSSGFTQHANFKTKFIPSGEVTRIHYEVGMRRYEFIIVTGYSGEIPLPLRYRNTGAFCRYVMANYPRDLWLTAEKEMSMLIRQDETGKK